MPLSAKPTRSVLDVNIGSSSSLCFSKAPGDKLPSILKPHRLFPTFFPFWICFQRRRDLPGYLLSGLELFQKTGKPEKDWGKLTNPLWPFLGNVHFPWRPLPHFSFFRAHNAHFMLICSGPPASRGGGQAWDRTQHNQNEVNKKNPLLKINYTRFLNFN